MAKYEIHLPTEQYGFILKHYEGDDEGVVQEYRSLQTEWGAKTEDGIPTKEFNAFVDSYLSGNLNGLNETYQRMNAQQQDVVQIIKRSLARLKGREKVNYLTKK